MSDQLSKVVAEMRDEAKAMSDKAWGGKQSIAPGNHAGHILLAKADTTRRWADRIESAAAPVEVDKECAEFVNMVGDEFGNEAGVRLRELFATLARQLAEAKAMLGQCYVMAGADTDGDAPERHAMDALRAVTDLRRDYDAAGEECYGRNGWQTRAEQAESQLAEAKAEIERLTKKE